MKISLILALIVSLGLNAAVAFLFLLRDRPTESRILKAVESGTASAESLPPIDADVWPDLQSDELSTLVSRLRASGFPPSVVRAILSAQLQEKFRARRQAISPSADALPFWKDQPRDPKVQAALRQVDREQQKLLRELLGADAVVDDALSRAAQNRGLGFLPPGKADEVRELMRNYDEQRSDLYATGVSELTDRKQMLALEREQHDAIARVLTPAELLEYDLRTSRTANNLRNELAAFNASEEEFRSIYPLRLAFDERFGADFGLTLSSAERRERETAQKLLTDQIKTTLGPERGAEYERAIDYNYRRTNQLVERLELPPETTQRLWDVQKEFQQHLGEVYSAQFTPEQRNQRLASLQEEATARLQPLLGDARAIEAYKQYGGYWLRSLQPPPASATGAGINSPSPR